MNNVLKEQPILFSDDELEQLKSESPTDFDKHFLPEEVKQEMIND